MRRRWRRPQPRPTDRVYIAVRPQCGCVVDAVLTQMARTRLRHAVELWLASGLLIGRVPAREASLRITRCGHITEPNPDQLVLV